MRRLHKPTIPCEKEGKGDTRIYHVCLYLQGGSSRAQQYGNLAATDTRSHGDDVALPPSLHPGVDE